MKKIGFSACTLLLLLALLCFADGEMIAVTLAAVTLHEAGHFAAIYCMGERIRRFTVAPWGLNLEFTSEKLSYLKEAVIALCGPLCNLLLFLAAGFFFPRGGEGKDLFCGINLILCLFNLIPVYPLDGGMILRSLLLQYFSLQKALDAVYWLSVSIGIFLLACGAGLFIYTKGNITILFASMVILAFCRTKQLYRIL